MEKKDLRGECLAEIKEKISEGMRHITRGDSSGKMWLSAGKNLGQDGKVMA